MSAHWHMHNITLKLINPQYHGSLCRQVINSHDIVK